MACADGEPGPNTSTSPGGSMPSVTAAACPDTLAASRRTTTAPEPVRGEASSSAASRVSHPKTEAASAKPGTATSTSSRAVSVRSSVVPIRAAASLSQVARGPGDARCPITIAPPPRPASGSQRIANRPSPSRPPATVADQIRPAAVSASAWLTSCQWPGPVSSTSQTCSPA